MPIPSDPLLPRTRTLSRGFSLVELLVAVLFISFLMAGMAKVFQASMGSFVAASETMASGRRNRSALDLLYDDLNQANMVASSLFYYPPTTTTNPPFIVNPTVNFDPSTLTDVPGAQAKADQLIFYYDNVLPYEATLATTILSTSQQVAQLGQVGDNASFSINLRDSTQAANAASLFASYGMSILFRSSGYTYQLATAVQHSTSASLDASLGTDSNYKGGAVSGSTFNTGAPSGTGVNLIVPGRYVRYSIQPQALDPAPGAKQTPCLVRDEVTYNNVSSSATPFTTPDSTTIVADNVIGFKVMLSGDGGKTWAGSVGTEAAWSDVAGASTGAASPTLNWQLQSGTAPARTGMNDTTKTPFWFREIPILVRVDVTTRTLNKRTEFATTAQSATTATAAYKTQVQSLILSPRHSGMAYQPTTF